MIDGPVSPDQTPLTENISSQRSWQEIRNFYARSRYSDIYEAAIKKFKGWESVQKNSVDPKEWDNSVNEQISKAKELKTNSSFAHTEIVESDTKVSAIGSEIPEYRKETLTRLYLGIDPRQVTNAYVALLEELDENGILKDINVALNLEELEAKKLQGNAIIIYEPISRPDVLNKILEAYRRAKEKSPEAFALSPLQKAKVIRENLRQFKGTVDANLSFVEIPAEDGNTSYDSGLIAQTSRAFGIEQMRQYSDEEWLSQIKKHENKGLIFTNKDQEKIEKGETKSGDVLSYKRKLSAPALVQYGTITAK